MADVKTCPFIAPKKCMEQKCVLYIHLYGKNPQTGAQTDELGCAITFIPLLLIENSQQQRQTGAAVESFRNEMVRGNLDTAAALIAAATGNPRIGRGG